MSVTPIQMVQQTNTDKTSNTSTPDVPFNKVLSNEMTQQQPVQKSSKNIDQSQKTDARQQTGEADGKPQTEDVAPQTSAEMLAMLGQLQPTTAIPQEPSIKGDGQSIITGNRATKISTEATAIAGCMQAATLATGISDSAKTQRNLLLSNQSNTGLTDQLALDPKTGTMADTRPDAKFSDMLKTTEGMNIDPRTAHLSRDFDTKDIQTTIQLPVMPVSIQPSAIDLAQNLSSQITDKLTPRVGSPAWDQALGQKIVWMIGGAEQSASISLNPPDLGPLQVVLNVTNDQANATFIAAQPEVRLAIEAALPKLREMMSDAGIQLGQTNVSADTSSHQGAQQDSRASRQSGSTVETTIDNVNMTRKTITSHGLVNTFV